MDLNPRYILGRLREIEREIDYLEVALGAPDKEILSSPDRLRGIKYSILLITEAIGAVLQHILARKHHLAVTSLAEAMVKAGEKGVINQNLAQSFEALARFRNRLVHRYWTVDDRVFLENLRRGLHEFRDFVSLMEREVQKARG